MTFRERLDSKHDIGKFVEGETTTGQELSSQGWMHAMDCTSNLHVYQDKYHVGYRLIVEETYRRSGQFKVKSCYDSRV